MECGSYDERVPRRQPRRNRQSQSTLGTAKKQVEEILATLPDDVSLEAIRYHIDIRQKIQQGWDERDRMISLEEIQRRLANWFTKWSSRAWLSPR